MQMKLLKLMRGPAMDAISKFVACSGMIDQLVTLPLKGVISEVKAGRTWKGPSADKFLEVLTGEHVPASQVMSGHLMQMKGNFERSIHVIDQADIQITRRVRTFRAKAVVIRRR